MSTRRDLVDQRLAFRNRLGAPGAAPVARHIPPSNRRWEDVLHTIEKAIAGIEADIAALMGGGAPFARSMAVLQSLGGIGVTTAATLLALMPERGTLPRRQAAALAGLAPHPRQRGKRNAIAEPTADDPTSGARSSWPHCPPAGPTSGSSRSSR